MVAWLRRLGMPLARIQVVCGLGPAAAADEVAALLCSDGLTTVVATQEIERTLRGAGSPDQTVRQLVDLANQGGGPDNIGCVVADVVDLSGNR
ncbi:MAG TPA: hypothetical protein VIV12_04180 [Streptosporangiaceae bacterium]